jgi:hypothetical protein
MKKERSEKPLPFTLHQWPKIPHENIYPSPPKYISFITIKMRGKPGAGEGYNGGPLLPHHWLAPTRSKNSAFPSPII